MKRSFLAIVIVVIFIISVLSIKPLLTLSSKYFWDFVTSQLDNEEQKRQQRIENGEIIPGKDTVIIWGNMFEIWNHMDEKRLSIKIDNSYENVLEKISKHEIIIGKLYVISDEGYAVIDKNNSCRVFITVSDDEFVNGFSIDEQGNKHYNSRYIKNENIQYLSGFNEYSIEEQKIFDKLKIDI